MSQLLQIHLQMDAYNLTHAHCSTCGKIHGILSIKLFVFFLLFLNFLLGFDFIYCLKSIAIHCGCWYVRLLLFVSTFFCIFILVFASVFISSSSSQRFFNVTKINYLYTIWLCVCLCMHCMEYRNSKFSNK